MKKKTESKAKIHASRLSGGALREDIDGGDHIRVNMDARQFAEMLTSKQTKVVVEVTR
jgi:hypothetical protein